MSFNDLRLFVNLFGLPVGFCICALVAEGQIEGMQASPVLASFAVLFTWGAIGLWIAGAITFAFGAWKLWCAWRGIGENCHTCGMPTRFINPGRYSPHYRCMRCGTNRNALQ